MKKIALALTTLVASACGGDDSSEPQTAFTLNFGASIGQQEFACGGTYTLGSANTSLQVVDLRFYISNISLVSGGEEYPATLVPGGDWQNENVALLDFASDQNGCASTAGTNSVVSITAGERSYDGIAFDLGVPFDQNHVDAMNREAPLNATGMQWNWLNGYKYLRVDTDNEGAGWGVHLGANQCGSGDVMTPPGSECAKPNRPRIRLSGSDPTATTIDFDFAPLVQNSDMTADETAPPGCFAFATNEVDCTPVFPALGMTWAGGSCENDCAGQTAFSFRN